ncbi:hypothetical protein GX888_03370 [Candidatus Dojkabacteria bacterium]|uniref:Uncharacterized protein n=1 Tax=Candidatus Dojkabacteria bacterium TaxID=2099670 RepID=A0A847VEB5_9BACT|nr:hypothetical protein [Candidatus Dojkabacteria bacterium]
MMSNQNSDNTINRYSLTHKSNVVDVNKHLINHSEDIKRENTQQKDSPPAYVIRATEALRIVNPFRGV